MRLLFTILLIASLSSCKLDVTDENLHFEKVPISNIAIPEQMSLQNSYTITFDYSLANGCYSFYNIDFDIQDDNTRIISALAEVNESSYCTDVAITKTTSVTFKPLEAKEYNFKFWIGKDNYDNDLYEEYTVNVE